jgi:hypothetical protein
MRSGAAGEIRTPDLVLRRHALYPSELQPHISYGGLHASLEAFSIEVEPTLYSGRLQVEPAPSFISCGPAYAYGT